MRALLSLVGVIVVVLAILQVMLSTPILGDVTNLIWILIAALVIAAIFALVRRARR